MMATAIPTAVLSDRLHEAIGGRTVKAAVFLTFVFEPGFFEEEILPLLFDQAFSHHSKLRLIQLEDRLRALGDVAVYYDRNALDTTGTPPVLDFERIPLERPSGCFHPKVVLLLLEEEDDEGEKRTSLLVAVLSANLTRRGWWESVETAVLHEIESGERSSLRGDLLELIRLVRRSDRTGFEHRALGKIHKFVLRQTGDKSKRTTSKVLNPRLFLGQKPLSDFLAEVVRPHAKEFNLEIISPYFDKHQAKPLAALIEVLQPRETRIYLPTGDQSEGQCSAEFFDSVTEIAGVKWSKLPRAVVQRSSQGTEAEVDRFVHAKVYRLWSKTDRREILLIGSVNLTTAAHSHNRTGNFEAALLFESLDDTNYRFWLTPIESPEELELTADVDSEDDAAVRVAPLSLRYSWASHRADYFWEDSEAPEPVELHSGTHLGTIDPVESQAWRSLDESTSSEIARVLESTSFVDVRCGGQSMGTVLVREEDMAKKPSILTNLTAEEILRYWSLLSSEQREAFLAARAVEMGLLGDSATTIQTPLKLQANTMFDQFAGIFHAFNRLEGHVVKSIEESNFREAEYRLFGKKYDSLPVLVDKVREDNDEDPTQRYIILLTAFQLLEGLRQRFPGFFEQHEQDTSELCQQLEGYKKLREHFDFATKKERARFFEWFEESFLTPAAVPR